MMDNHRRRWVKRLTPMRHVAPVLPVALLLSIAAPATRCGEPPTILAAATTAKERLSNKGSDEQRVDDCKVPPAQRTRTRPAECSVK
jgi:hypothetical protein